MQIKGDYSEAIESGRLLKIDIGLKKDAPVARCRCIHGDYGGMPGKGEPASCLENPDTGNRKER